MAIAWLSLGYRYGHGLTRQIALSGLHMPNRPCLDRCEFGSAFMGPNKPIELYLLSFTFFSFHSPRLSRPCHASAVAAVAVIASAVATVAYAVVATASLHFLVRGVEALALEALEAFEAKHQVFSTRSRDRLTA